MLLLNIILSNWGIVLIAIGFAFVLYKLYESSNILEKEKASYILKEQQSTSKQKEIELLHQKREAELRVEYQKMAIQEYERFKQKEMEQITVNAKKEAFFLLEKWKIESEEDIREDARKRSLSVNLGRIKEHLLPFHEMFVSKFNSKDARFIGSPIDLIVFDGDSEEKDDIIIWIVEVKSGNSGLTKTQNKIREAIRKGKVRWAQMNPDTQKIDVVVNNLEQSKSQLGLFDITDDGNIEKVISEIGISPDLFHLTLERIRRLINNGDLLDNAIENVSNGIRFKNSNHKQILIQCFRNSLK